MFTLWILVGLGMGWGGGRLLAPTRRGVPGHLVSGVFGSVVVAWTIQAMHPGATDGSLIAVLGGAAGALLATFAHRAFADRYRRVIV